MSQLATQVPDGGLRPGLNADVTDIPKKRFVKNDSATNGEFGVALATAATDKLEGVTTETLVAGRLGDVQKAGTSIVTSGAAVVAGTRVTSDGSGKAITTTTQGNTIGGLALTAASGADVDILVELQIGAHVP